MWQWYRQSKTIALIVQNLALFKNLPIAIFIWSHMFYNPIICFILLSRPRWEKQLWYIIMFHFFTLLWPKYRKKSFFIHRKERIQIFGLSKLLFYMAKVNHFNTKCKHLSFFENTSKFMQTPIVFWIHLSFFENTLFWHCCADWLNLLPSV